MSARIRELANLFPEGRHLIDVGSDHGYLGLELLRKGKTTGVTNIDLSGDALRRSLLAYRNSGMEDRAVFLLNDGFSGEVDCPDGSVVVIAGLGTSQILRILEKLPGNVDDLMLMSHTDYYRIRKWGEERGFSIVEERYLEDGDIVYLILVMERRIGDNRENEIGDYIFGRREFWSGQQRDLFIKYWRKNSRRIMNIPDEFRSEIDRETMRGLEGIL